MTTPPNVIILLGLAAIAAGIGDEVARQTSRRLGWLAAGPFVLLAASPLVPNYSIALGFSLDDALPLLGLLMMLPLVPWGRLRATYWAPTPGTTIALAGILTMIVAGLISAVLVGGELGDVVRLAIRGSGRWTFLLLIVVCVAVLGSTERSRLFSARVMALVGTFEAAFGLVAYFIGFPRNAGLEATRQSSVLFGEVPGRISGTLGISPNFTAAILMITILVSAGLALRTSERRERVAWWAAVVVQFAALTLTYTRVSLGLAIVALAILVLLRSRPILLLPIGAVLVPIAVFTPMLQRLVSDMPDRLALWTSAFLLMIDHPFFGVGAGQMAAAVAQEPERYRSTIFGQAWSTAHNTVLLAGAETGVLGAIGAILLNLGLAVIVIHVFLRAPRGPAGVLAVASALALGAFLAQGMVNNLFTVGVTGLFAAFLLGSQLLEARLPLDADGGTGIRPRGWSDLVPRWWRPAQDPLVPGGQDGGGVRPVQPDLLDAGDTRRAEA